MAYCDLSRLVRDGPQHWKNPGRDKEAVVLDHMYDGCKFGNTEAFTFKETEPWQVMYLCMMDKVSLSILDTFAQNN